MIDTKLCMGLREGSSPFSGEFCQAPATHSSVLGRRCDACAERLRVAMRSPDALANVVAGRPRTEEEIAKLVVKLQ